MSIFKAEKCPICGMNTGALSKSTVKYEGMFICQDCLKKLIESNVSLMSIKKHPLEELQRIVGASQVSEQEHLEEMALFQPTKKVGDYIYFDDNHKKFALPKISIGGKLLDLKIYDYSEIIDFELLEDENTVTKGGVGRAIVGGALFGGVGAIVGSSTAHKQKTSCSKLEIKITMNNINQPNIYIVFIVFKTDKKSALYKLLYSQAQEVVSLLSVITQSIKSTSTELPNNMSSADEIVKFKYLLDSGIITQEEFDTKKKELLGL